MECLPVEILQEIVGHLPEKDLNSVRLVNHGLSAASNVFKYRILRVRVSRQGLNHLLYVSQQPALAHCVREIIYPYHHLPQIFERFWGDSSEEDFGIEYPEIWESIGLAFIFF
ncbi:hypothetical protein RUND412_009598, partial [Rhizina undulata]